MFTCTIFIITQLQQNIKISGVQFYVGMDVEFRKAVDETVVLSFPFQTRSSLLVNSSDLEGEIMTHRRNIIDKIENFTRRGSGYIVTSIKDITLMVTK